MVLDRVVHAAGKRMWNLLPVAFAQRKNLFDWAFEHVEISAFTAATLRQFRDAADPFRRAKA
jgi:hypothetical protein